MNLTDVNRGIHKHKKRKRVGRGVGSGHGKTSGRGHKGQGALAGWSAPAIFEGGASPLIRRVPKRGFLVWRGHVNDPDLNQALQMKELDAMSQSEP